MSAQGISRRQLLGWGGGLAAAGLTGLAGCGSPGAGGERLTFMYWGSSFESTAVRGMLDKFSKSKDGVSVRPIYVTAVPEYETKMNTFVASKREPDVAYLTAELAYQYAERGKLLNLYEYFDKYPQIAERLPTLYHWWDKDATYGTQTANEVVLLWYNKALLDDAGVKPPPAKASEAWDWDALVSTADKLTFDDNGKRPSESGFDPKHVRQFGVSVGNLPWYALLRSNGGDVTDESGTKFTLNSPEGVEVFQKLQDLVYEHRVAPSPAQLGNNAPTTTVQLQTKRIAMAVDGQWALLDMSQSDVDYGIGVLPSFGEPKTLQMGGVSVIFKSTKHPDDAMKLYLYHNDPEHVDLFRNGLWMPLHEKYYTDPAYTKKWLKQGVHPPEYQTAVVDYARENAVTNFAQRLRNMPAVAEVLTPALDVIATGKKPAKQVLDGIKDKVESRLKGWYPTQEPK